MLLAKNQRNFVSLDCEDSEFDLLNGKKVIAIFGSNGQGKSTIKKLFLLEDTEKNFQHQSDEQSNSIYEEYKHYDKLSFDEEYTKKYVFENDGIATNQLKVILKTDSINKLLEEKTQKNNIISSIKTSLISISIALEQINVEAKYTLKKPTSAQLSFASTILGSGNKDLSELKGKDLSWWFQGYSEYQKKKECCPWCDSKKESFPPKILEIVDSQISTLDSSKTILKKATEKNIFLNSLKENERISANVKGIAKEMIETLKQSTLENHKDELKGKMKELAEFLENDLTIINNLKDKFKLISDISEIKSVDIEESSTLSDLKFLKNNQDIQNLNKQIKEIKDNINTVVNDMNSSNQKLIKLLNSSMEDINGNLRKLGMNFHVEILKNNILSNDQLNDNTEYVVIKSNMDDTLDLSSSLGTVLSYGEHNTLAFAIFLAELKQLSPEKLKNTIVIFDDPISSYDIYRRYISISMIKENIDKAYKTLILTHENSFAISLTSSLNKDKFSLFSLTTTNGIGKLQHQDTNKLFNSEIQYYKEMTQNTSNHVYQINALRKLTELNKRCGFNPVFPRLYNYLCMLYHYRKNEIISQEKMLEAKKQLKELQKFYGFNISLSDEEDLLDKEKMLKSIDEYYEKLKECNFTDLALEDVLCLRILAEKAIRDQSNANEIKNVYSSKTKECWSITDSVIEQKLVYYSPYLNSLCHLDNEEANDVIFNLFDYKFIPPYIKETIFNIIFSKDCA